MDLSKVDNIYIPVISVDETLVPQYQTCHAAGCDLKANLVQPVVVRPHETVCVPTGICAKIPPGYMGQIMPRSGLFCHHQIFVFPGTIDSGYPKEIRVMVHNMGIRPFKVTCYMRIAQLVISRVSHATFLLNGESCPCGPESKRTDGFGSTGIH